MLSEPRVFAPLKAAAATELARQIESLEPSAGALNSKGFNWMTAAELVTIIKSGKPDLAELRCHGLTEACAVEIATAIAARHARKAAALAALKPLPALPSLPVAKPESTEQLVALSLLHDLAQQIDAGRGCVTELHRAGFTESTAKELSNLINASRRDHIGRN